MGKKITLTSITGTLGELSVDEIESVDVVNGVTFVVTKGKYAHPVKESKSRILKMIETAK
nr:MAG TPA: Flagellar and Swarming motility protein [Caudoviricetes sp.]